MQDPELFNQLKERLPEALFEKLNGSLCIDRDRLRFAEYKVRVLEERLRLVRIEKYGPGSEKLSETQLELLELEPGVSSAEVQADDPGWQRRRVYSLLLTIFTGSFFAFGHSHKVFSRLDVKLLRTLVTDHSGLFATLTADALFGRASNDLFGPRQLGW